MLPVNKLNNDVHWIWWYDAHLFHNYSFQQCGKTSASSHKHMYCFSQPSFGHFILLSHTHTHPPPKKKKKPYLYAMILRDVLFFHYFLHFVWFLLSTEILKNLVGANPKELLPLLSLGYPTSFFLFLFRRKNS